MNKPYNFHKSGNALWEFHQPIHRLSWREMNWAQSPSRLPTKNETTSLVSASKAVHVHTKTGVGYNIKLAVDAKRKILEQAVRRGPPTTSAVISASGELGILGICLGIQRGLGLLEDCLSLSTPLCRSRESSWVPAPTRTKMLNLRDP